MYSCFTLFTKSYLSQQYVLFSNKQAIFFLGYVGILKNREIAGISRYFSISAFEKVKYLIKLRVLVKNCFRILRSNLNYLILNLRSKNNSSILT